MTNTNELKEAVNKLLSKNNFISYLDLEIIELGPDRTVGRVPFSEKLLNPYGTMHGGCLYALADTVGGTLANMNGKLVTTTNGNMSYLNPAANTRYVYCEANLVRCGQHLVTVDIQIKGDDNQLFDVATFTFFRTDYDTTRILKEDN